jgi:hypothetical protein
MGIALYDYVISIVKKYNPNHDSNGRFASGGGGGGVASGNRPVKDIQDMPLADQNEFISRMSSAKSGEEQRAIINEFKDRMKGGVPKRTDGAAALHRNLAPKLDAVSSKIDALPKEPKIAGDIAQARVGLSSAAKAPSASGSATSLLNAHQALDNAANRVVGRQTPLAFQIKDIRQEVKFLADALQRP